MDSRSPDWPARLELFELTGGRRVLMDAAHNIDGATALADYLRRGTPTRPTLVFGVMHDKDVDAMLSALLPVVSSDLPPQRSTTRALPPEELARRAAQVAADLAGAERPISDQSASSPIPTKPSTAPSSVRTAVCVAGSIFLAGAVLEGLRQRALLR